MSLSTINYLIINFSCLLCAAILFFHTGEDLASDMEIRLFKLLLIVFGIFLIDDSLWELAVTHSTSLPIVIRSLFNAIGLSCQPLLCFVWFLFSEVHLKAPLLTKRWFIPLTMTPMLICVVLIFTSLKTGLIFYSTATAEYHGPLYDLVMIFDFIYLLLVTIHAIIKAHHTKSFSSKRKYFSMIAFVLFPFTAGLFDSFVPNTPIMSPSILSALLLFFVNVQEMRIYSDALTGLNNRRRSNQMLEESIEKANPHNDFYVLIMDINQFKQINDHYGHIEGDHALQCTAHALKNIASQYSVFLSRWGGDEFMIICPQSAIASIEEFKRKLEQSIISTAKTLNLPYCLSISVGYSLCTSSHMTPAQLTQAADLMLYQEKHIVHHLKS